MLLTSVKSRDGMFCPKHRRNRRFFFSERGGRAHEFLPAETSSRISFYFLEGIFGSYLCDFFLTTLPFIFIYPYISLIFFGVLPGPSPNKI